MKHVFTLLLSLVVSSGLLIPTQAQTTALPVRAPSRPPTQTAKQASARQVAPVLNATAAATIRYVKAPATGNGSGTSWSNASGDLQAMINASASGDQVWIAGGTYKPSTTGLSNARIAAFSLKNGVSVLGGFTGAAGTEGNVSARTAIPSSTTLSGDIGAAGDASDNTYHVVSNNDNALNNSAVLDGVAIIGGNANGSGNDTFGGGMVNIVSAPSIFNCQFSQNTSVSGGGGMCIAFSQFDSPAQDGVRIISCSFQNNTGYVSGVYNQDATKTVITNCFFDQNSSVDDGVFSSRNSANYTTSSTLTNCTFSGNTPRAITLVTDPSSTSVNLINCLLWNNGGQAAIDVRAGSTLTASYCLIETGETDYTNVGNNRTLTASPFDNATGPALSKCAPAVDAGNDAANTTTTDVLGNTRKLRTIDIGAAEYLGAPYVAPTLTPILQTATTACAGTFAQLVFDVFTGADGVTAGSLYRDNTNLGDAGVAVGPNQTGNFRKVFQLSQSGTYQIVVVSTCSSLTTTFAPITVNPLPTSYDVTGGGAYCAGGVGSVVGLSGSQTGVNYQLLRGGNPVGGAVAGTGDPIIFGPQSTMDIYTVRATNATTACPQDRNGSAFVSINALPSATITPAAMTICAGQSTNLTASGADTYRWNTTQTTASISVSAAGPYSVTGTSTRTGCSNTATASVTVTPLPNASFTGLPASVCVDAGPSTLSPAASGGTFSGPGISGNQFSPATAGAGGPYSVTYTVSSQGCPNTSVQNVTVKPLPQAPAITTQAGRAYPAGVSSLTAYQNTGEVILIVSGCAGGTITWSGGNSQTLSVSTTTTGVQTFTATCTSDGCTSPVGTATVTVVAPVLTVSHQDVSFGQFGTNTILPYLQLNGIGTNPIAYNTITVRYWLTVEGPSPITRFENYYVQLGAQNVRATYVPLSQPRQGATAYVEYSFDAAAGSLGAMSNSGPIQNGFGKADYSGFNQADDYSYVANRDYTLNPRITAYINGQLSYGQEPTALGTGPVSPLSVSLTATATVFPATDNTTLVAQAAGGSGVYTYTFSGPGTITPSGNTAVASALPAGVQTFTVTVTDTSTPSPGVAIATVSVTVTGPPNTPPVATANANQTATVGVGFSYPVNTFSDAQTPGSLTYSASITPQNGLVFNPITRVISGTPSQTGVSAITLTATDPGGLSTSTSFSVTVQPAPNTAPLATANANQTATVGVGFTYTVAAFSDAQTPGQLTYSATITPANGLSFASGTRIVSGTPSMSGVSSVTVTATDPGSLSASTTLTITVSPAPVVGNAQLTVLHQDVSFGQTTTNTILPYLQLVNSGSAPLAYQSITVRYWLTVEGNSPITNFQHYYVQIGANNVHERYVPLATPRQGATAYVEYSFDAAAGSLGGGTNSGPIQNGFTKADYSFFNQSDDYSYAANRDYTPNARITAYVNGVLVYGQEPPVGVRVGATTSEVPLRVQVLGNPLVNEVLEVMVSGGEGQSLVYQLTDTRGRVVVEQRVDQAGSPDHQRLSVRGQSAGVLLLRVSTPRQSQTVKVLKGE